MAVVVALFRRRATQVLAALAWPVGCWYAGGMPKRPLKNRSRNARPGAAPRAVPYRQPGGSRPSPAPAVALTLRARLHMAAAGQVVAGAVLILLSSALWAAVVAVLLFLAAAGTLVWARRQA